MKDLHPQSIVNLVTYIESLDDQIGDVLKLTKDLLLWDSFFKKLKSNTNILRHKKTMHSLLRLIIMLFKNSLEHPVSSVIVCMEAQDCSCILTTFYSFSIHTHICVFVSIAFLLLYLTVDSAQFGELPRPHHSGPYWVNHGHP